MVPWINTDVLDCSLIAPHRGNQTPSSQAPCPASLPGLAFLPLPPAHTRNEGLLCSLHISTWGDRRVSQPRGPIREKLKKRLVCPDVRGRRLQADLTLSVSSFSRQRDKDMPLPFSTLLVLSAGKRRWELAHPKYRWEQEDDQTAEPRAQPLQGPFLPPQQVRSTGRRHP